MKQRPFDRAEHVYRNDEFAELVKDAVRFFNGTPVLTLPLPVSFHGRGVYAIYYIGKHQLYAKYGQLNRTAYEIPIYVGKAVPKGWRRSRTSDDIDNQSSELFARLRQHHNSIKMAPDLDASDFKCRFVIFEHTGSDMISTVEAALIKLSRPLWNTVVDGFGNHDPGKGRYEQAKSDWDVIHPGRKWAAKCNGVPKIEKMILARIKNHLDSLRKSK
ncbi:MAG: restriction endonuclease [Verrucomicrobiales bacterium]|nr:restriction endonuclease [Verrucomicrobiales bacterium]